MNRSLSKIFMLAVLAMSLTSVIGIFVAHADRDACTETCCSASKVKTVYEPAQRAIILWNGQEEILFLATELGHQESAPMVEIIALPAEPSAKLGSQSTFVELSTLAAQKDHPSLSSFVSHMQPGKITHIQAISVEKFASITAYSSKGNMQMFGPPLDYPTCLTIASRFSSQGFPWLVLDALTVKDSVQSFPPIEYRFKSGKIFYPLQFSVENYGQTVIDLLVISREKLTKYSETIHPIQHLASFSISSDELAGLRPEWSSFMGTPQVVAEHLRMVGDIRKMTKDIFAQ